MPMSPEMRSQRSRIGAYVQWSRTPDRAAHTAPARAAFLSRFDREVDPKGTLDPAERARRAEYAQGVLRQASARVGQGQGRQEGR